jgi:hypothetical protein
MIDDSELMTSFDPSAIDQILFYIAFTAMKTSGHRHGAFLDAAATAAKCVIYQTYLEEGQNLRLTGHLHHLEPKRVKAIVSEIDQALTEGKLLKILGSTEPSYLIRFPYLWLEKYPWQPGTSRIESTNLTPDQKAQLEAKLPENLPNTLLITSWEFLELISLLHDRSEENLPENQRNPISEAFCEHIKRRLLHAKTVIRIDNPWGLPFYALTRATYSPVGQEERTYTMIEDTARYFRLMKDWANSKPEVMRLVEEFDILPEQLDQAQAELDQLIRAWADKYHTNDGKQMIFQMVFGNV